MAQANKNLNVAVFAGGCFWCTEAVFQELKGVISVMPGYTGGQTKNPTYEQVCSGKTGHAEATKIEYDPAQISFEDLLTVFFATHDPTTGTQFQNTTNRDIGSAPRGREARAKAYPGYVESRSDTGIAERSHIPSGFGSFLAPLRYTSGGVPMGTPSSTSLAGSGKEPETRSRGILDLGSIRQGNDVGTQYRSAVFYTTEEQKAQTEKFMAKLNESGPKVVTEVKPLDVFYDAEEYHRNYYKNNSTASYCQIVINPKLEKLEKRFGELLKSEEN